ncbi:biotin-dependent carboxyltransferase family protein [Hydrogenophaga sp.]|uniref:5-oxoprolinase subunit C family protein n=1 Tax=Hydrogenophaga sp. TaxID=1904254 RepID=UPI0025BA2C55|nr:biotin-dependent carboxyltransferase family protein [Hydrogenophaga sp.]
MTAEPHIEVISPGAYASVQDTGRRGYRRVGVPWAGVLDPRLMRVANALVGNADGTPVIECFDGGLQLVARGGNVRLAVAGHAVVEIESAGERRVLGAWRSLTLTEGDTLRLRRLERGRVAVIAIEGMALPTVLGSVSTYARAALGGVEGRALSIGSTLPATAAADRPESMLPAAPTVDGGPIRLVAGPQADHFSVAALANLVDTPYQVTPEADRMGVRLEGAALEHIGSPEIVSDATVPGSIQVPGTGQPIVLLADAQTAGGYPKIATVISTDLPRFAAARPGESLRFMFIDTEMGENLARAAEAETRALLTSLRPLMLGGVDEAAIYAGNLVSGFIDALSAEHRPLTEIL